MQLEKEKESRQDAERCRLLAQRIAEELAPESAAVLGDDEATCTAHGGRLSGSVGADQADHLSFPDLEGDAADGFNLVKGFGQSGNFKQNGLCHGCWGRGWFPAAGPETVMRVFSHLMESRVGMGPNSPSADIISA